MSEIKKLTYDEFLEKMNMTVNPEIVEYVKTHHGVDVHELVDSGMRAEYEFYINGGFDKIMRNNDVN